MNADKVSKKAKDHIKDDQHVCRHHVTQTSRSNCRNRNEWLAILGLYDNNGLLSACSACFSSPTHGQEDRHVNMRQVNIRASDSATGQDQASSGVTSMV